MGLNGVFSIAKSSLFAHQQALAVTANNLANANNPAYSRQVALFGSLRPDSWSPIFVWNRSCSPRCYEDKK